MEDLLSLQELKQRVDDGAEFEALQNHPAWRKLEAHMKEQQVALALDTATNAESWEDYLAKRAFVKAIDLLLTNIADFVRMGEEAKEEIQEMKRREPADS